MMPYHRKEALIESLQGNIATGYKRRKLKMNESVDDCNNGHELTSADMEIEDSDDDVIPLGVTVIHSSSEVDGLDTEEKVIISDNDEKEAANDVTVCEELEPVNTATNVSPKRNPLNININLKFIIMYSRHQGPSRQALNT
jgi:hypothetical protein